MGAATNAEDPLHRWGPQVLEPLPTQPLQFREPLQQGLEVEGIAHWPGPEYRCQLWVINGEAFAAAGQGQQGQAAGAVGVNLAAEVLQLFGGKELPQYAGPPVGGAPHQPLAAEAVVAYPSANQGVGAELL